MLEVIGAVGVVVAIVIGIAVLVNLPAPNPYRVGTLEDGRQVWRARGDLGRPREFIVAKRDGMVEIREVEGTSLVAVAANVVTHGRRLSSVKRRFRAGESGTRLEIVTIYGPLSRRLLDGVISGVAMAALLGMLAALVALAVFALWGVGTLVSLVF